METLLLPISTSWVLSPLAAILIPLLVMVVPALPSLLLMVRPLLFKVLLPVLTLSNPFRFLAIRIDKPFSPLDRTPILFSVLTSFSPAPPVRLKNLPSAKSTFTVFLSSPWYVRPVFLMTSTSFWMLLTSLLTVVTLSSTIFFTSPILAAFVLSVASLWTMPLLTLVIFLPPALIPSLLIVTPPAEMEPSSPSFT